jgi:hypothetical protein
MHQAILKDVCLTTALIKDYSTVLGKCYLESRNNEFIFQLLFLYKLSPADASLIKWVAVGSSGALLGRGSYTGESKVAADCCRPTV